MNKQLIASELIKIAKLIEAEETGIDALKDSLDGFDAFLSEIESEKAKIKDMDSKTNFDFLMDNARNVYNKAKKSIEEAGKGSLKTKPIKVNYQGDFTTILSPKKASGKNLIAEELIRIAEELVMSANPVKFDLNEGAIKAQSNKWNSGVESMPEEVQGDLKQIGLDLKTSFMDIIRGLQVEMKKPGSLGDAQLKHWQ